MSRELIPDSSDRSDSVYGKLFNGKGYYISTVAVTSYNNNINMLNDSFTLYIFNENIEFIGYAYVSDLNARKLNVKVGLLSDSDHIRATQNAPDTEFIWFTVMGGAYRGRTAIQKTARRGQ